MDRMISQKSHVKQGAETNTSYPYHKTYKTPTVPQYKVSVLLGMWSTLMQVGHITRVTLSCVD